MASARELLEQADALMRRNRGRVQVDDVPVLVDAVVATTATPARPAVPPADQAPVEAESLDEIPLLTDIVEEIEAPTVVEEGEPSLWLEQPHRAQMSEDDSLLALRTPASGEIAEPAGESARPAEVAFEAHQAVEGKEPTFDTVEGFPTESDQGLVESEIALASVEQTAAETVEPGVAQSIDGFEPESVEQTAPEAVERFASESAERTSPEGVSQFTSESVDRFAPGTIEAIGDAEREAIDSEVLIAAAEEGPPMDALGEDDAEASAPQFADDNPLPSPDDDAVAENDEAPAAALADGAEAGAAFDPAAEKARLDALAEEIGMQVLQRVDLFTDTGLRQQLAARLQPIVDRASAELVASISQQVGVLLRAYVSEAIEREIENLRSSR